MFSKIRPTSENISKNKGHENETSFRKYWQKRRQIKRDQGQKRMAKMEAKSYDQKRDQIHKLKEGRFLISSYFGELMSKVSCSEISNTFSICLELQESSLDFLLIL